MNYLLTEIKQQEQWLYNYHAKMLQMVSTQLESAQKSLIERKKKGHKIGQLQFVGHDQYRSFTYNQPQELRKVTPVEIAHGSLKQENAILLLLNRRSQL